MILEKNEKINLIDQLSTHQKEKEKLTEVSKLLSLEKNQGIILNDQLTTNQKELEELKETFLREKTTNEEKSQKEKEKLTEVSELLSLEKKQGIILNDQLTANQKELEELKEKFLREKTTNEKYFFIKIVKITKLILPLKFFKFYE